MSKIAKIIRIKSLPHGDAPEDIRAAWVGCQFRVDSLECGHIPEYVESVLPQKRKGLLTAKEYLALPRENQQIAGYNVRQTVALRALRGRNKRAAKWWEGQGYPKKDLNHNCFRFKTEEVKVVKYYSEKELEKFSRDYRH